MIPSDPGNFHAVATGSAIYRISMYEKCITNNLILILTPTLTDPVTPYYIRRLEKAGRSVAGFVVGVLPYLKLYLRQFLRMFM